MLATCIGARGFVRSHTWQDTIGHYLLSRSLLIGRMSIGGGAYRRRHGPPGLRRASGGREAGKRSTGAELGGEALLGPAPREGKVRARNAQEKICYYKKGLWISA